MSALTDELIQLTQQVAEATPLPDIVQVILPPIVPASHSKYSKFGLMILEDNSAGFFYRLLDQPNWEKIYSAPQLDSKLRSIEGVNPVTLVTGLAAEDPLQRGLGMAAINAISQHVFRKTGFKPGVVQHDEGYGSADAHVGMVGFFGPMIEALQRDGIRTTVIELDETRFQQSERLLVTGDITQLVHCDTVYCTASTLLNDTLETVLQQLQHNPKIALIGPTCGCFPDPFFKRGVNKIGGSEVVNPRLAVDRIQALEPWGDCVRKYEISADTYPGYDFLMKELDLH